MKPIDNYLNPVGECENSTTKTIEVLENPLCSPVNNTITLFSTMTFNIINCWINSSGHYEMGGSNLQGDFRMEFYVNPLIESSAIYEFSTDNENRNNVFMQIDAGGVLTNWQATSGKLYVRVNNNQITVTFCNAVFGNIQSTSTKTASGKISCP